MELKDSFSMALKAIPQYFSAVQPTLPPAFFFKVPPSPLPRTLPPPSDHPTLSHPFTIPYETYNQLLQPLVPVTIALLYVTVVTYLNAVNERRKFKPWAFSQTAFFKAMVITHNTILALYSLWTCIGMVNALRASFYSPWEEYGIAGTVDSLCKINGPRGYGTGAAYNETTSAWGIANHLFHLGADGLEPDSTDVGRIWNEGLAFYGWLFYLSKYYEVIDTFIILAKGRKSSFLQTYHHAGAMICMWAGIRYMSPPIWMFVLVNSFIHTIMYTFYLCISLHITVPVWFKRTLTTMQITQFVVGATYAFLHLFIKYKMPVSMPYLYRLGSAVSAAPSAASSVISTAVATADGTALLKRLLLRAAGREGLAENVLNDQGQAFGFDAVHAVRDFAAREEWRYRQDTVWTHCIDTSGQAFAIWLNCLYLAPLTWLFARFFIRAYLKRDERRRSSSTSQKAYQSGRDAYKGVTRRLSEAFEDLQHGVLDSNGDELAIADQDEFKKEVKRVVSNTTKEVKKVTSSTKKGMNNALGELKEKADPLKAKAKDEFEDDLNKAKAAWEKTKSSLTSSKNNEGEASSQDVSERNILQQTTEAVGNTMNSVTEEIQKATSSITESISETVSQFTASSEKDQTESGNARTESKQVGGEDEGKITSKQQAATSEEKSRTAEQATPKLRKNESSHRSTNSQEFEDQQSSWIHVKDEAEEAVENAVDSVRSTVEQLKPTTSTKKEASEGANTKDQSHSESLAEGGGTTSPSTNVSTDQPENSKEKSQLVDTGNNKGQTKKERQSTGAPEPSSSTNNKDKSQKAAKQGSSASNQSSTDQNGSHSASQGHEHLTYAEVAAQDVKHEDDHHGESQLSEGKHESATTSSVAENQNKQQSGKSQHREESLQRTSSSNSTRTETTSIKRSTSGSHRSGHFQTRSQFEGTSQVANKISVVKAVAQTMEGEAKTEAEKFLSSMESKFESGDDMSQLGLEPDSSGDGSLWFEKLTTGIDSKTSKAEKREIDEIIDESETVRDEVVNTAEGKEQGHQAASGDDDNETPSGKDKKDKSTEDDPEDGA